MRPVRWVISPTAGVSAVVDDEQIVVGIERQLIGIKRAFGLRRRERERFGKGAGRGEEGGGEAKSRQEAAAIDGERVIEVIEERCVHKREVVGVHTSERRG